MEPRISPNEHRGDLRRVRSTTAGSSNAEGPRYLNADCATIAHVP